MAICSNCKQEGTRVRTVFIQSGTRDECPHCAPGSFEKFTAPSDKKIWMGYEAHPNEYVKSEDGGFDRKAEYRAEQEESLRRETEDERTARLRAESRKRATRRTDPMDSIELSMALRIAGLYADALNGDNLS